MLRQFSLRPLLIVLSLSLVLLGLLAPLAAGSARAYDGPQIPPAADEAASPSRALAPGLPDVAPVEAEEPIARALFFYSERCLHCQAVAREVLPPLQEKYGQQLQIVQLEVAQPENYELMLKLEDQYQLARREIPEIFVGGRGLVGEEEIRGELDREIAACLANGGCEVPAVAPPAVSASPAPGRGEIHVAYFFLSGCGECDRVKYDLDYLKTRYPGLAVSAFDVASPDGKTLNEALGRKLGVPESQRLLAPAVFVGEDYLVGSQVQAASLSVILDKYAEAGAKPSWQEVVGDRSAAERSIVERFRSFGVAPVLVAGLVDGLNPCAFATIIFFVSYLTVAGRRGREILLVGGAFTLGVFLSYLLIGLGFLTAIKSLAFLVVVARAIYLATAALCLVLAILSVRDFLRIRRGGLAEMSLQLPAFLKERVRKTIRERARTRRFVLAAFASGFVISFLELLCTGQIYLPIIVFVAGIPELRAQATLYLVLYNLMFVLPLVGVFVLTYFGTTSRDLTRFLQTRAATIKLLMAGVFVALGGWLVYAAL